MIVVALLLTACTPEPVERTWLAGDLHVHSSVASDDTDGLGTPEVLAEAMAAAGLDFVFVTDHSNSAGSMHCDPVEDCPNLGPEVPDGDWPAGVTLGSEISPVAGLDSPDVPTGHIGCLPLSDAFIGLDAFVDRPVGTVTGGEALQQCIDHGGWGIVNHPEALLAWIEYDWTSEAFDALEVYNGTARFDNSDARSVRRWEERVAQGRRVVPVGGSDCHRWGLTEPNDLFNPPLGWPTTWVAVAAAERPIDGLAAGRVIVAEPGSELAFSATRRDTTAGPGETIRGDAVLTATGTAVAEGLVLEIRDPGGDTLASQSLAPDATVTVEVGPGVYYARIWTAGGDPGALTAGIAIANAIRVE